MAVKSDFQRKGIGTKMLQDIITEYKNKGFTSFMGIVNRNAPSRKMFEKLGVIKTDDNFLIERRLAE